MPASAETQLQLELENGSRIISLPGKEGLVRGSSAVALLLCDEASRIMDEMYYGLRPMLAVSGGRIVLMSTPWGRRGFFFTKWTEGTGWERYEVPASQCPRISPAFLAEEKRTLGPWWYRQEYECQFSDTTDQLFSHEVLQASLTTEIAPLWGS